MSVETKYKIILARTVYGHWREYYNTSLKKLPFFDSHFSVYQHIYIINDDLTHTLIWSNGKLVK